jgi:hypothetical protein
LDEVLTHVEPHRAYLKELMDQGLLLVSVPWILARAAHCCCAFPMVMCMALWIGSNSAQNKK